MATTPILSETFIKSHQPWLWLHSQEASFPTDVEDYLAQCTLHDQKTLELDRRNRGKVLNTHSLVRVLNAQDQTAVAPLDPNVVLSSTFFDTFKPEDPNLLLTLQLRPDHQYWLRGNTEISKVPIYAYQPAGMVNGKIYLHYIFFYANNAAFPILFGSLQMGQHDSDLEHVTLEIDAVTQGVQRIFYGAHGQGDGRWRAWDRAEKYEATQRPIVYVAKGSHACYPSTGNYLRFAGVANDHCDRGYGWNSSTVVTLVDKLDPQGVVQPTYDAATMGFLQYTGDWGFGNVSSLRWKSWWSAVGASKERENKAPTRSSVDFRLDIFILLLVLVIFFICSVVGFVYWARSDKGRRLSRRKNS